MKEPEQKMVIKKVAYVDPRAKDNLLKELILHQE
jgi:hypothetical protein